MLAEILAAHDYRTVAFTGGGHVSAKFGFGRGFERYEEDIRGFGSTFGSVEEWIRGVEDEPFFLFLHSYDIHLPYDPPAPFDSMFTAAGYDGPVRGDSTKQLAQKVRRRKDYENFTGSVDVPIADQRQFSDLYDGGIRYTDQYVARLVSLLRELDLWSRTIVVVFSDHGEEFWDHGSVAHGHTLYQELIWVPLVFYVPGIESRRVDTAVGLVDVAPTLLELAGIEVPGTFLGDSLLPWMQGEESFEGRDQISEIGRQRSLTRLPWKIIVDLKTGTLELYDVVADPRETRRLESEHPEVAAELQARLLEILSGTEDADLDMDAAAENVRDEELREQLRALGYIE
jgi:arylsulfatase A-like enzyme